MTAYSKIKLFGLILFIFNLTFAQSRNSNFEFSGMDQFWKITDKFSRNQEPNNSDWDKLFKTPGYKILTSGEFTKEFFKEKFRLIFKPSEKNNLQKALKNDRNKYHLLHYKKVKDNTRLIREQYKKLKQNKDHRVALNRTLEYLPQRSTSNYPPVSFLIFESNGRGSSPIIVDLAASLEWDFVSFLAHEYHHWYRARDLKYNQRKVSNADRKLIDALNLIEAEGVADMVDKKDWYTKPSNAISRYARTFINDVKKAGGVIKSIDESLIQISKNPSQIKNYGQKIWQTLPQRGHTTGYYMARLILEKLSKRELVDCVGDPFKFILKYNKAAKKAGGRYPIFSDASIKVINGLSQKYSL